MKKDKVVIIGAGFVGACCAYTMMLGGTAGEIVLIDIDRERLEGEVLDLSHGLPFVQPVQITAGNYADCKDAELVIITAGAAQQPGESRLSLIQRNVDIFKNIIPQITRYNTECILLVVTNPVDVITYVAQKLSGFPANRVIGSGTVLDSARFRYLLGEHCHVAPTSVHGYVIGEHGDSEVCAFSRHPYRGDVYGGYLPDLPAWVHGRVPGRADPFGPHRRLPDHRGQGGPPTTPWRWLSGASRTPSCAMKGSCFR